MAESKAVIGIPKLPTLSSLTKTGTNWFDMPAPTITPELKRDLHLLKLRPLGVPLIHRDTGDSKSKTLRKYFQVGTIVESAEDFYSNGLAKKERKTTLADELLSDSKFGQYRKRKVWEIEEKSRPGGVKAVQNREGIDLSLPFLMIVSHCRSTSKRLSQREILKMPLTVSKQLEQS